MPESSFGRQPRTATSTLTQLLNYVLLTLAVWNLEATGVSNFVSGDGVVRIAILEGGWAYSPSVSKRASARVRVWGNILN